MFSDLCRVYELLGSSAAFLGADCEGRTERAINIAHTEITRVIVAWFDVHLKELPATSALQPNSDGEYRLEQE